MIIMNALGKFIAAEMKKRDMSQRQFAEFVGVSHVTIGNALSYQDSPEPSIQFLVKLARATKTDLCSLLALIYPDDVGVSPQARILAERIERLPPNVREVIDQFIISAAFGNNQHTSDSN